MLLIIRGYNQFLIHFYSRSFNDILNLAAKKQHEEIVVPTTKKEQEKRLLTKAEKEEIEEREARERRRQQAKEEALRAKSGKKDPNKKETPSAKMSPPSAPQPKATPPHSTQTSGSILERQLKGAVDPIPKKKPIIPEKLQPAPAQQKSVSQGPKNGQSVASSSRPAMATVPNGTSNKKPMTGMRPQDDRRPAGAPQKGAPQRGSILYEEERKMAQRMQQQQQKGAMKGVVSNKRKILDESEDEEEYDSDFSDFIDDEGAEDVSSYIKEIFGYDKSR